VAAEVLHHRVAQARHPTQDEPVDLLLDLPRVQLVHEIGGDLVRLLRTGLDGDAIHRLAVTRAEQSDPNAPRRDVVQAHDGTPIEEEHRLPQEGCALDRAEQAAAVLLGRRLLEHHDIPPPILLPALAEAVLERDARTGCVHSQRLATGEEAHPHQEGTDRPEPYRVAGSVLREEAEQGEGELVVARIAGAGFLRVRD
jgi:hypothetical protein